jgi:hypothetical protein
MITFGSGTCAWRNAICILPCSESNANSRLSCAVDVCFHNWAQVLLVRVSFLFLIRSYFSKLLSFGPSLPGWVVGGVSVDFFGNTEIMICWRLALRGGLSTLVIVVDGTSFSPVGSRAELVLDLLVCNQNSSDDTLVTGSNKSCLGLFSFGTCGVVVYDTVAEESCCSASTKVFGSHTIWFVNFLTPGLDSWTYMIFLFFTLISEIIPHGL